MQQNMPLSLTSAGRLLQPVRWAASAPGNRASPAALVAQICDTDACEPAQASAQRSVWHSVLTRARNGSGMMLP
jgi:hypothetical protein